MTKVVKIEVPPYETSGSGIPVTGAKPIFIAILTKAWKVSIPAAPRQNNAPKLSCDLAAVTKIRQIKIRKTKIIASEPTNPVASAQPEKIKSICATGTNCSCDCVAFPNPLPVSPPEPTAIFDWLTL